MREAVRDPRELCRLLDLPPETAEQAVEAAGGFPLFVPRGFLAKITPQDPRDPLLLQVLPRMAETEPQAGFTVDPVDESDAQPTPGLLKKYSGRALLVTTAACGVHCRYCFRRHFPYDDGPAMRPRWRHAIDWVAADETIDEVILSGGDPLTLTDELLAELAESILTVDHIKRLRIHTRIPVVIPERVTDDLIGWLTGTRLTPIVVVHANHPREICDDVAAGLRRLIDSGIPVLNQSVLLAGVNDDIEVLTNLCRRLIDLGVMPYYLHQLDRVAGAAHFEVSTDRGRKLIDELRRHLPGYAVPRYVQEVPGESSKVVIDTH